MALEGDSSKNGPLLEVHGVVSPLHDRSHYTMKRKLEESVVCIQSGGGVGNMKLSGLRQEPQQGQSSHIVLPAGGISKNSSSALAGGSSPAKDAPIPSLLGIPTALQESKAASWSNRCALQPGGPSSNPCSWYVNLRVKLCI